LRGGAGAVALGEEHVVVLAAVERRVEVDEVDGLVVDVLAQDGQVVAVIETVHFDSLRSLSASLSTVS
jgi:hypothetical protein